MQPPMRDLVHLPIHLGGIKPSTHRDTLSVALMSNVQCLVTAVAVENHQIVPCWYAGLSRGMRQLSVHMCKKCIAADMKWFIFLLETELRSTGTAHHFAYLLNTSDYRILRMDEDYDRMYIGSKDHILSLDLHDINKEPHIVSSFSSHSKLWPLQWAVRIRQHTPAQPCNYCPQGKMFCSASNKKNLPKPFLDSWKWLHVWLNVFWLRVTIRA